MPVIPVRMTEAWLLFHEGAIRQAAGNPNGSQDLHLQTVRTLDKLPDPKRTLHDAIMTASGLNARRRGSLPVNSRVHLIPSHIDDFSPLDALPAFRALQEYIRAALQHIPHRY
ncbi:MAG: hypothetical protein R2762_11225 [Bryobacteraceae bacterium]